MVGPQAMFPGSAGFGHRLKWLLLARAHANWRDGSHLGLVGREGRRWEGAPGRGGGSAGGSVRLWPGVRACQTARHQRWKRGVRAGGGGGGGGGSNPTGVARPPPLPPSPRANPEPSGLRVWLLRIASVLQMLPFPSTASGSSGPVGSAWKRSLLPKGPRPTPPPPRARPCTPSPPRSLAPRPSPPRPRPLAWPPP